MNLYNLVSNVTDLRLDIWFFWCGHRPGFFFSSACPERPFCSLGN